MAAPNQSRHPQSNNPAQRPRQTAGAAAV